MHHILVRSTILFLLASISITVRADDTDKAAGADGPTKEIGFPNPFELNRRFHVVSEEFDSIRGYSAHEDFVDFDLGKATFTQTIGDDRISTHYDADVEASYVYKPYECKSYRYPALPDGIDSDGIGLARLHINGKNLQLFGVLAIWARALRLEMTYELRPSVYSTRKGKSDRSHTWTVEPIRNVFYRFYCHDLFDEDKEGFLPEMIEIEDKNKGTKRIINLLSIEYEIEPEISERELNLPLMYGCQYAGSDTTTDMTGLVWKVIPNRLRLEITATKIESGDRRSSDTVSYDVLSIEPSKESDENFLVIRQRGSKQDTKTVVDFLSNVIWTADYKRGSCEITNGGRATYGTSSKVVAVEFANGLKLETTREYISELISSNGTAFIKNTREGSAKFAFSTMDRKGIFGTNKLGRVVRKYWVRPGSPRKLESITVWIIEQEANKARPSITEIYHFNVFETGDQMSSVEKAHVLDVSRECYLDNNKMKYGIDYAWLELHYPLSESEIEFLPAVTNTLKNFFYQSLTKNAYLNHQRLPQMELMFSEDGLSLRLLLLDSPAPHLFFAPQSDRILEFNADDGDHQELAPDIEHCSQLCKIHKCRSMSYSPKSFLCMLTNKEPDMSKAMVGSTVYRSMDDPEKFNYYDSKLPRIVANLQHIDWSNIKVPAKPTELQPTEYGLSLPKEAVIQAREEYIKKLDNLLQSEGLKPVSHYDPQLGLILVPNSFELEQDPLAEFGLATKDELGSGDQLDELPAFHQGLSGRRFNFRAFEDSKKFDSGAQRYTGVDYDQCALACVDSGCSSFSYCRQRQECVVTSVSDLKANEQQFVQPDDDCLIAQRDFMSRFHKFADIEEPAPGRKQQEEASNPSECAHNCATEQEFNCLAFTYCRRSDDPKAGGRCLYADNRSLNPVQVTNSIYNSNSSRSGASCDHYSRSYLADFVRIEYRKLNPTTVASLVVENLVGKSVDQCAEMCATKSMDCSGFQFCYDPEATKTGAKQLCDLFQASSGEKQDQLKVVLDRDGQASKASNQLLVRDEHCHVFALRKDSSEAKTRQLSFSLVSSQDESSLASSTIGGMTLGGSLMMFVCATFFLTAVAVGLLIAHRDSYTFRRTVDGLRGLIIRH